MIKTQDKEVLDIQALWSRIGSRDTNLSSDADEMCIYPVSIILCSGKEHPEEIQPEEGSSDDQS